MPSGIMPDGHVVNFSQPDLSLSTRTRVTVKTSVSVSFTVLDSEGLLDLLLCLIDELNCHLLCVVSDLELLLE